MESIPLSCVLIHNSTNIFAKSHSRFSVPPLQRHKLICGNLIISLQSLLLNPQTQMSNLNDLFCHIYNNAPKIVEFTASCFFPCKPSCNTRIHVWINASFWSGEIPIFRACFLFIWYSYNHTKNPSKLIFLLLYSQIHSRHLRT